MNAFELVIIVAACCLAAFALVMRGRERAATGGGFICPNCETQGRPETETKGSIFIEIILWICLIVPGLIYSIWRLTTRHKVCGVCGSNVIPLSSPRGQQLSGYDRQRRN